MSITLAPQLRLASRENGRRDGELVLVSPDLTGCVTVPSIARTLQEALDNWSTLAPQLMQVAANGWSAAEPFKVSSCLAPLPRAYQWVDGSVYRHHAKLMYQWRNEPIPPQYEEKPLVYQGGSDVMLKATAPIEATGDELDIDFEAEIAVITTDVPIGVTPEQALDCIALVVLLNDVSLRRLIPDELARGFGFYQSKPATSFAPVAVTPAALGANWRDAMLHLPVRVSLNGKWFGAPDAGHDTAFHFGQLIAHLACTRALAAGTIVGAGTISNADPASGSACITEARVRQALSGVDESRRQPYLAQGDQVRIEVLDANGRSVFGAIEQQVVILQK